jgi:hypothetical protein
MKDNTTNVVLKRVISPVSVADNTAQVGQIIDRQGFDSVTYGILTGSLADVDATFTVLLEESNDPAMSGAVPVADADMISQGAGLPEADASFTFAADDQVRKLGYIGNRRYTRLTITPGANASAAVLAAFAMLSNPDRSPVTQPTA